MKAKTVYICQQCGFQAPKWSGQCPDCGAWNTLVESLVGGGKSRREEVNSQAALTQVQSFSQVETEEVTRFRLSTGVGEFDRVLGEGHAGDGQLGLVQGSVVLLAGEPGIGKSTLLTQTVINVLINLDKEESVLSVADDATRGSDVKILYVNGEESAHQISDRLLRVHKNYSKDAGSRNNKIKGDFGFLQALSFSNTIIAEEICSIVESIKPKLLIIDSIQTVRVGALGGAAGSFGQLRESTQMITEVVKRLGIPTILVGHVTKEGTIAGPKILEHMVDAVLELSGERTSELRTLRAVKNRFGATDEVGLFRMEELGLIELTNPSELFLQSAGANISGSAVVSTIQGNRPLLIEVQALVVGSQLAIPRRIAQGIQMPKLQVLTAVLQKHAGLGVGADDIFVNIAGGMKLSEPAIDLGIALAIVSSKFNQPLPAKTVCIGEVGLLGEIRSVPYLEKRIKEAKRLGFRQIISASSAKHIREAINLIGLKPKSNRREMVIKGMEE